MHICTYIYITCFYGSVSLYETDGRPVLAVEVRFSEANIARCTFVCCSVVLYLRTKCMLVRFEVASFELYAFLCGEREEGDRKV